MTSRQPPLADKPELRSRLLAGRRSRSSEQRAADGTRIAEILLDQPEVRRAGCVAAYVSVGTEPPTGRLLEVLRGRGVAVLLPVLLQDHDLAWAEYAGPHSLEHGPRGMRQPGGPRLSPSAVTAADALVCPGLAVDATGLRLGRGGGSYDRVLARLPADIWTCVVLYAEEVLEVDLPSDPHDRRVQAAVTPDGVIRLTA